jgi:hypothetical protein
LKQFFFAETLLEIGFYTLSSKNSTYPYTLWDKSSASYACALAKNSVSEIFMLILIVLDLVVLVLASRIHYIRQLVPHHPACSVLHLEVVGHKLLPLLYRAFLKFPVGAVVSVDEPLPVLEDEEPMKGLLAYISVFFRSSLCELIPWNEYSIYSVHSLRSQLIKIQT